MAFRAATMLHKEYGTTRSPWYRIGGYTVATATAVSRMLNNKHWLSDVMVGAGIGILSTEVGYFLTDLIFKDKGITHSYMGFETFKYQRNPSYETLGESDSSRYDLSSDRPKIRSSRHDRRIHRLLPIVSGDQSISLGHETANRM